MLPATGCETRTCRNSSQRQRGGTVLAFRGSRTSDGRGRPRERSQTRGHPQRRSRSARSDLLVCVRVGSRQELDQAQEKARSRQRRRVPPRTIARPSQHAHQGANPRCESRRRWCSERFRLL